MANDSYRAQLQKVLKTWRDSLIDISGRNRLLNFRHTRQGHAALHATGSWSFTQTMRRHVGKGSSRVQNMFKYFNSFIKVDKNTFEVLICDEAHRIRETSANRFTRAAQRTGRPQVDELIAAARVPVFLLDEHQVVKPNEIGTVEAIKSHASTLGFRVHHIPARRRCGSSRKYED